MDSQEVAFQGEVMLLQWSDSSTRGRTITLLLSDDADVHPFKDFTIKSGKRAGQRFMCAMAQIGDDEQPVKQAMRNSQLAYLWCNDPSFLEWAKADSHDAARERMLKACGVSSRSELDSGQAAVVFENRIKTPYIDWRKEQGSVSI
jgi:hypothetical protein